MWRSGAVTGDTLVHDQSEWLPLDEWLKENRGRRENVRRAATPDTAPSGVTEEREKFDAAACLGCVWHGLELVMFAVMIVGGALFMLSLFTDLKIAAPWNWIVIICSVYWMTSSAIAQSREK